MNLTLAITIVPAQDTFLVDATTPTRANRRWIDLAIVIAAAPGTDAEDGSIHDRATSMSEGGARVCVYSQRGTEFLLSRCVAYEFEDAICDIDRADLVVPEPRWGHAVRHRLSNRLAMHTGLRGSNPGLRPVDLDQRYDLFFAACMFPRDLVALRALPDWKDRAAVSICWLEEIWADELPMWRGQLKQLSDFDHVILNCAGSVDAVQQAIGKPCTYIPPGVDAIRFSPYPDPPDRVVDVYGIGRRSPVVHSTLREMANRGEIFYIHDTLRTLETERFAEHRQMIAGVAKRSRFFLVDVAKRGREFETRGQSEVGFRFFEGAAAGAVMMGDAPDTAAFEEHFGWPDAVVTLPDRADEIVEAIRLLATQEDRLQEMSFANAVHSLRQHDWAHRWKSVLDTAGLEPMPAFQTRVTELEHRARGAEDSRKA